MRSKDRIRTATKNPMKAIGGPYPIERKSARPLTHARGSEARSKSAGLLAHARGSEARSKSARPLAHARGSEARSKSARPLAHARLGSPLQKRRLLTRAAQKPAPLSLETGSRSEVR